MMRPLIAILVGLALTSSAVAAPRKVLVLPLGGDAPPELRAKYSASVQRLARTLDGKVTAGDVTFTDTATAIGCDPRAPKCAEDVRATLGVDELIYGTVTKEGDKLVVVVVRRHAKDRPDREVSTTLEASASPDNAEPAILPLFQRAPGEPEREDVTIVDTEPDPEQQQQQPQRDTSSGPPRNKVLAYAAIGGGATLLLISFSLWSSASGLEDDIRRHSVDDREDFDDLIELEDRASARAWTGNVLFLVGLGVGGLGGWMLYRERKAQSTVVSPTPVPGGAALMLRGIF